MRKGWRPASQWSQSDIDKHNEFAAETNKAWTAINEQGRRSRVAETLGFKADKLEINSGASTSSASTSKDPKKTRDASTNTDQNYISKKPKM